MASGTAGGAAAVGGAVASARLVENAAKAVLAVVRRLSALRISRSRLALAQTAAPAGDVAAILREEASREAEFRRRAEKRVRIGLRLALRAPDPSARSAAVDAVLRREQQYARQRATASAERLFAAVEREALRRESPRGAFWELGPTAEHTPDCLAMQGKLWSWEILDKLHPPMHVGCKCRLRSYGEALAAGLLRAPGALPTPEEARKLAAPIVSFIEKERATEDAAVAELLLREELRFRADPDRLAASPLRADALLEKAERKTETRAMVALYPDPKDAEKLALKGGTKPEELHVTLAFLGEAEGLPFARAATAVAAWAKETPVLKGEISGVGHFDVGAGDVVTYRSVDLPDLPAPREKLVKRLEGAGASPSRDHGFHPHMTIDGKIRRPAIEKTPLEFRAVTLAWAGELHSYPLAGKTPEK